MDKDVPGAIVVVVDQVAGGRMKGYKTAVAADAGNMATIVPLIAVAHRNPRGGSRLPIIHKDIGDIVCVAID